MKKLLQLAAGMLMCACLAAQTTPSKPLKADPLASRKEIRVVARNTAAEVRAPLSAAELAIAQRVHAGTLPCELGQVVVLTPDLAAPGFFALRIGKENYHVSPEETTTGAIRLEDKAAGVVWLQLANKSMLMNQKLGKRMADECKSPAQILVAEAMLKDPPPSVLDAPVQPVLKDPPPSVLDAPVEPVIPKPAQ